MRCSSKKGRLIRFYVRVVTLQGPITNPIKRKINFVTKIKNMKSKLIKTGYCPDVLYKQYFYKQDPFMSGLISKKCMIFRP